MGRVVINRCYGGFGLSAFATDMLEQRGYKVNHYDFGSYLDVEIDRHNEDLLEIVEILGEDANGMCAELQIIEFDGSVYRVEEYDGLETLVTPDTECWVVIE